MIRATQRALRLIRNDRRFAVEFIKGPYLDLGKDRDRFAERIYERRAAVLSANGHRRRKGCSAR